MTDKASIEAALANLPETWKPIDVLINNAGLRSAPNRHISPRSTSGKR